LIILGIDPGSRHTGWGVIEKRGERLRGLGHGRISCPPSRELARRLADLAAGIDEVVESFHPDAAALETSFHGVNSRSLIVLAQARGALLATLARRDLEIREYSPATVKSAVSGSGRADKQQVAKMVRLILAVDDPKLSVDASDALAVAICCAQRYRLEALAEGAAKPAKRV